MKQQVLKTAFLCLLIFAVSRADAKDSPVRVVYGSTLGNQFVTSITFVEENTGEKFKYSPKKDSTGAAEMGTLFYKPVVSPSNSWMCLPVGAFEGFVYFPMSEWKPGVEGNVGIQFYARSPNGPALMHRFVRWLDGNSIRVSIGIDGDDSLVDLNLTTNKASIYKGDLPLMWIHFTKSK